MPGRSGASARRGKIASSSAYHGDQAYPSQSSACVMSRPNSAPLSNIRCRRGISRLARPSASRARRPRLRSAWCALVPGHDSVVARARSNKAPVRCSGTRQPRACKGTACGIRPGSMKQFDADPRIHRVGLFRECGGLWLAAQSASGLRAVRPLAAPYATAARKNHLAVHTWPVGGLCWCHGLTMRCVDPIDLATISLRRRR